MGFQDGNESMASKVQDAMSKGIDDLENEGTPKPEGEGAVKADEKVKDDKPAEGAEGKEGDDKPKWDGKDRRAAKEIEMEFDTTDKDGKPSKLKLGQKDIKEVVEYFHGNREAVIGAIKLREISTKNPEFGKLLKEIVVRSVDDSGNVNKDFVGKQLTRLEEKIENAIDKKDDDIVEMEADLDELDPDSPQAKILKRSISALKATKAQLEQSLKTSQSLQEKIDGLDKFKSGFEKEKSEGEKTQELKRLSDVFNSEFGNLAKEAPFDDEQDKDEFEKAVRAAVADLASNGKVKNDDDFKKAIQESFKSVKEKIEKRRESIINKYLQKKGLKPKDKEQKEPDKEKEDNRGWDERVADMGNAIADAIMPDEK